MPKVPARVPAASAVQSPVVQTPFRAPSETACKDAEFAMEVASEALGWLVTMVGAIADLAEADSEQAAHDRLARIKALAGIAQYLAQDADDRLDWARERFVAAISQGGAQ